MNINAFNESCVWTIFTANTTLINVCITIKTNKEAKMGLSFTQPHTFLIIFRRPSSLMVVTYLCLNIMFIRFLGEGNAV